MNNNTKTLSATLSRFQLLCAAFFVLFVVIIAHAAVMEDPYISFRVVDNVVHGDGLRWSIDERVQPSTNILWMLLHVPFYWVWRNIYAVTLLLSLLCTAVAVFAPLYTFKRQTLTVVALFVVPLALSGTFVNYSTSGFENPLQHALFAWCGWIVLRAKPHYFWFLLSFCVALSMVNRLDVVFFYVPLGVYFLCLRFRTIRWRQVWVGAAPIIVWELFSLFYYGFLFANSKYAKLNTSVSDWEYIRLGGSYLLNLLVVDPVSGLALLWAAASIPRLIIAYRTTSTQQDKERVGLFICVALGIVSYTLYIVAIGGTYLGGRLLSLPVYAAFWLLLGTAQRPLNKDMLCAVGAIICAIKLNMPTPDEIRKRCPVCFTGINLPAAEEKIPLLDYVQGKAILPQPRSQSWFATPAVAGSIGRWGYSMKPDIRIVDYIAISDPLLARLPCNITQLHTIGILPRDIPRGYLHFLKTGEMGQMDADLAAYYTKLRFIISGDLWNMDRLREIVRFNRGDYEMYRLRYIDKTQAAKTSMP